MKTRYRMTGGPMRGDKLFLFGILVLAVWTVWLLITIY